MKIIYPIIQEPIRKNRKDKLGNTVNDARQYKKTYCKVFKITGKRLYEIINKLERN